MEMEGASMFSHRLNACPQIDYLLLCFTIFGPAGGYRILFVRHAQIRLHPTSQLTVFIVCTKKAFHKFCCSKVSHSTYFETNIIYAHDGILPPPLFSLQKLKKKQHTFGITKSNPCYSFYRKNYVVRENTTPWPLSEAGMRESRLSWHPKEKRMKRQQPNGGCENSSIVFHRRRKLSFKCPTLSTYI